MINNDYSATSRSLALLLGCSVLGWNPYLMASQGDWSVDLPSDSRLKVQVDLTGPLGPDLRRMRSQSNSIGPVLSSGRAGDRPQTFSTPRYLGGSSAGSMGGRSGGGARSRSGGGGGGGGQAQQDIRIGFGPDGAYRDFSEDGEGGSPIDLGPLFGYIEDITMGAELKSRYVYRGFDILSRYAKADFERSGGVVTTNLSMTTSKGWNFGLGVIYSLESDYVFPLSVGVPPNPKLGAYNEFIITAGKRFDLGGGFYGLVTNELIWFPEEDQWDSHFMNVFSAGVGYGQEVWDGGRFSVDLVASQFSGQSISVRGTGLSLNAALLQDLPEFEAFGQSFNHAVTLSSQLHGDKDFNFERKTGLNALDLGLTYAVGMGSWNFNAKAGYSISLLDYDPNRLMRDGFIFSGGASFSF